MASDWNLRGEILLEYVWLMLPNDQIYSRKKTYRIVDFSEIGPLKTVSPLE